MSRNMGYDLSNSDFKDEDGNIIHPDFSDPNVIFDCVIGGPLLSGIIVLCLAVAVILFAMFPILVIAFGVGVIGLNRQFHFDTQISDFLSNRTKESNGNNYLNRPKKIYGVDKNGGMNYFRLHGYGETPPEQKEEEPRWRQE